MDHSAINSPFNTSEALNDLLPIHRLPTELLSMIFARSLPCSDFSSSGYVESDVAGVRRAVLSISSVCRQWRSVANGSPSLWTVVETPASVESQTSTPEYLARSGRMPLSVSSQYPPTDLTMASLAPHADRIHQLYLELPEESLPIFRNAVQLLPPVPNLQCLVLAARNYQYAQGSRLSLLARPPPHLRVLIIKNVWCYPEILYGRLTHLNISRCMKVHFPSLLTLLGRCTALESLVLVDLHNATSRPLEAAPASVHLPALRTLTLGMSSHVTLLQHMLSVLALPPTVTVRVFGKRALRSFMLLQLSPPPPFAATFDTLVFDNGPEACTIQASGPSDSRLLFDNERVDTFPIHWVSREFLASLLPFARIKRLTLRRRLTDTFVAADMPSLEFVRLIGGYTVDDEEHDRGWIEKALGVAKARFPHVPEMEVWSASPAIASLVRPEDFPSLRKLTICHLKSAWTTGELQGGPVSATRGALDVRFRVLDAAEEPVLDLPGIRPAGHRYGW
ncbi:hypothetical protein ACG7TL_003286 [Trametes sanguinea]